MTVQERNKFIMKNYGLILKCVSQCRILNKDREDLIQDAMVQVLRVINKFNPEKGSFSTFIWPEIKQYVYRQNCGMADRTFKMSCRISRAKDDFEKLNGREPSDRQLAQFMNLNQADLIEEIRKIEKYNSVSLDSKQDDGFSLYDCEAGNPAYGPEEDCMKETEMKLISAAFEKLSEKEKKVIELRYNFSEKNKSEFSLRETAVELKISHETVRVIEKNALKKMKDILEEQGFSA